MTNQTHYFVKTQAGFDTGIPWEVFTRKRDAENYCREYNREIVQEHFNGDWKAWVNDSNSLEYYLVLDNWDEHPDYPREDWATEAMNGDTVAGYWEWLATQLEYETIEARED